MEARPDPKHRKCKCSEHNQDTSENKNSTLLGALSPLENSIYSFVYVCFYYTLFLTIIFLMRNESIRPIQLIYILVEYLSLNMQ